jgi:hypothetical protein
MSMSSCIVVLCFDIDFLLCILICCYHVAGLKQTTMSYSMLDINLMHDRKFFL